jgi:hypothetical protein
MPVGGPGIALPDLTVDLGDIRHPLIRETERIAPGSPQGQKRILSIREPLVYRIRHSGFRGATWLDDATGIIWLCAVERREEDSDGDAFVHFLRLHGAGRLLPNDDDYLRDRSEAVVRLFKRLSAELLHELHAAFAAPGYEREVTLHDYLPARLLVLPQGDVTEVWCALSTVDSAGHGVPPRLRDLLFARLQEELEPALWEVRGDWPSGEVRWAEVVMLGLKEV